MESKLVARKHVNADELNFRSAPNTGNNIIGVLRKAQIVETLGNPNADSWCPASALLAGQQARGFLKATLLREPVSNAREALIAAAVREWFRFDKGHGEEHKSPYYKYVGEMWQALGLDLDGRDREQYWSAAFISWIVRQAGSPYNGFKFAAAHARYIHHAINAKLGGVPAPFWGFRIHEHPVQLGDLICQWRVTPTTYDQAKARDSFPSHCDVVVEINGAGVRALGGNNDQSVAFKTYARNPAGFIKAENNVFAILRNNT